MSPPPPQRYNVSGATNSSFLNTSGDSRLSYPGAADRSNDTTVINNYGYDITEVHTTGEYSFDLQCIEGRTCNNILNSQGILKL